MRRGILEVGIDCKIDDTDDVEVADAAEDDEGERARLVEDKAAWG